jgi:alkanesulfonate monooxygenase SsuD/methylene tetrahydromethanopterin reductase-like flavin-dependent oxidoreductase (luciferase family)
MQFGIFYEIQVPKPWHEAKEFETYHQVLDQVQLADEVGFDTFWTVEPHFLTEFSHERFAKYVMPHFTQSSQQSVTSCQ